MGILYVKDLVVDHGLRQSDLFTGGQSQEGKKNVSDESSLKKKKSLCFLTVAEIGELHYL